MTIEIVNKKGELIANINSESNPTKVGDIFTLSIQKYEGNKNILNITDKYKIISIEHIMKREYFNNILISGIVERIEVTKI